MTPPATSSFDRVSDSRARFRRWLPWLQGVVAGVLAGQYLMGEARYPR